MQQLEPLVRLDGVRDGLDRDGVGEVSPNGHVREQEVVLDHGDHGVDVGFAQTEPRAELADHRHAHLGVVPGIALPDVVEERSEHQEVGSSDWSASSAAFAAASHKCRSTVNR